MVEKPRTRSPVHSELTSVRFRFIRAAEKPARSIQGRGARDSAGMAWARAGVWMYWMDGGP